MDILKNLGDRQVKLVEVKNSTMVSDIYFHDVAYQVYVLTNLGFTVEKACLAYINSGYVRHGALDLQALFTIADLTETTFSMQAGVEECVRSLREYMAQTNEPEMDIGGQCFAPYPCGFFLRNYRTMLAAHKRVNFSRLLPAKISITRQVTFDFCSLQSTKIPSATEPLDYAVFSCNCSVHPE